MGCDIHIILEARDGAGIWHAIQATMAISRHTDLSDPNAFSWENWEKIPLRRAKSRNYELFSILSDVRSYGNSPATLIMTDGIPDDASTWTRVEFEDDCDLHSHGHATLADIKDKVSVLVGDDRALVAQWFHTLQEAAHQDLAKKSLLVDVEHIYETYDISAHERMDLKRRLVQEREAAGAEISGGMPESSDLDRLRVVIAYDN